MENITPLVGGPAAASHAEASAPRHRYSTLPAADKAAVLVTWLEDNKARDPALLDVSAKNPCLDVLMVVTATSVRHARSLADGLLAQSKQHKFEYLRMEGYQAGEWILVDLNDIVVHIFQAETRELYRLEALWPEAPRLGETPTASTAGLSGAKGSAGANAAAGPAAKAE